VPAVYAFLTAIFGDFIRDARLLAVGTDQHHIADVARRLEFDTTCPRASTSRRALVLDHPVGAGDYDIDRVRVLCAVRVLLADHTLHLAAMALVIPGDDLDGIALVDLDFHDLASLRALPVPAKRFSCTHPRAARGPPGQRYAC